jgi:nitrate/nitrite transporter NarK
MFSAVVVVCITFRVVFTMLCARFDGSKVTHCALTVVAVQSSAARQMVAVLFIAVVD